MSPGWAVSCRCLDTAPPSSRLTVMRYTAWPPCTPAVSVISAPGPSYRVGGGLVGEAVVAGVAVLGGGDVQPEAEVLPGLVPHQLLALGRRQQEGGVQPRLNNLGRGHSYLTLKPSLSASHFVHQTQPPPPAPAARSALNLLPHLRLRAVRISRYRYW